MQKTIELKRTNERMVMHRVVHTLGGEAIVAYRS